MLLHKADRTVTIINIFTCHFIEIDQIFNCKHLITPKNKVYLSRFKDCKEGSINEGLFEYLMIIHTHTDINKWL